MKNFSTLALRHHNGLLEVLDQQQLPQKAHWIPVHSAADMVAIIKELRVRGAPLIGVAAAVCLARLAENGATPDALRDAAHALRAARPTAVNLMHAVDRMLPPNREVPSPEILTATAEAILDEDELLCRRIAEAGVQLIDPGDGVLTHCNSGGLATAGLGTALGILVEAHRIGRNIHVYVDETRPLLQGGRLTAWELLTQGVPHTLICDNMAAVVMAHGWVQRVFVGADRIAKNGDFANKIGTYSLAVLANYHKIPFYVAAPGTTLDLACTTGADIPIELRDECEVRGATGGFGSVEWAPQGSPAFNPAFDVTPASLVTAWILDGDIHLRDHVLRDGLFGLSGRSNE